MVIRRIKPVNIAVQYGNLKSLTPDAKISMNNDILVWSDFLQPTPLAKKYKVKIVYKFKHDPDVYVIKPKLELFTKATALPHIYSTEKQWLCLYYRRAREWKSNMLLSKTIIPWSVEWLYFYELWLATGKWLGGGNEHAPKT